MSEIATFWDKIADRYARKPVADEASYQKKLDYTRKLFKPEMEVLELGCGTGSTAISHAPYVKHVRGVDISSRMLEIAQGKADAQGISNVTFDCAAIDDVEVPDASVDLVMMHSILHLLENKEAAIGRVYGMLRPGGWFVSSTTCMCGAMRLMRPVITIMRWLGMAPQVVKFFTPDQLQESIRAAGFTIAFQWQPSRTKALFIVARKPE